MMDDDELDQLVRAANPSRTAPDAPLTVRQRALMERIMADAPSAAKPRLRFGRWAIAVPMLAAALLIAGIAISLPFASAPAAAYGPPPLRWQSSSITIPGLIANAHSHLSDAEGPPTAVREATTTSWNLEVNEAGEPEQHVAIVPIVTDLTWNPDRSGRMVTTVGVPLRAEGELTARTRDDLGPPGTVLDDRTLAVGEYSVVFPDAETLDENYFRAVVESFAPGTRSAGDAMIAVENLMGEWTFSNKQMGDVLDVLAQYDDLQVLGTTEDRLGRAVLGIRAEPSIAPGETKTLLISAITGRIVGMETTVADATSSVPVPAGTVISYSLWKDTE